MKPFHLSSLLFFVFLLPSIGLADDAFEYDGLRVGEIYSMGIEIREAPERRILIAEVVRGSAAYKAALKPNDLILSMNGHRHFKNTDQFIKIIQKEAEKRHGTVFLRIQRKGRLVQCFVTLDALKAGDRRPMDHGDMARYSFEGSAMISYYENSWEHLPQPNTPKAGALLFGNHFIEYAAAIDLVNVKGIPEDLHRAHAKMYASMLSTGQILTGMDDANQIVGYLEKRLVVMTEKTSEWAALLKFYDQRRKTK